MDCSWSKVLRLTGWEFARPDSKRVLAFAYTATVSVRVEESCVSLNPQLSPQALDKVLTTAPEWLDGRSQWLKAEWPTKPVQRRSDLECYALTASKALLAAGAKIPDGTHVEMLDAVAGLFPELSSVLQEMSYEAWSARVTIDMDGNMGWGYGGPLVREGLPLPFKDKNLGDRSAFEVFLQNQMRIDIQSRLESLSNNQH